MYHCYDHGIDHTQFDCPKCVAQRRHEEVIDALKSQAEAQAEALKSQAEAMADAEAKRFNPGDYVCPHCLYTTLKYYASRCPICQGPIDGAHWERVVQAEKEAEIHRREEEERRLREWEKVRPEREKRAQEKAREERETEREAQRQAQRKRERAAFGRLLCYVGGIIIVLLPALSKSTADQVRGVTSPNGLIGALCIPLLNYLVLLPIVVVNYGTPTSSYIMWSMLFWALCGGLAFYTAAKLSRP